MRPDDVTGRRRLPGPDDAWQAAGRREPSARDSAFRRTRRTTSWTAAALIAGVATATGYFARAVPPAAPATSTAVQPAGGQPTTAPATSGQRPSAHHAVVTSGGSGVAVGNPAGGSRSSRMTVRDN